uniref:Putative ovule protein n=1 Tax=Solanum chacoense TaxID=4108 RepID=A0A0V0HKC3_SOLCH
MGFMHISLALLLLTLTLARRVAYMGHSRPPTTEALRFSTKIVEALIPCEIYMRRILLNCFRVYIIA